MSLRDQSLRGGAYLAFRQALGVAIRLIGVLAITRLIGPEAFGLYAGSLAVVSVLATIARFGTETYLIRLPGEPDEAVFHQTFSFVLVTSVAVTLVGVIGATAVVGALDQGRYLAPLLVMCATIPINVLWAPAQARIERAFAYRRMAFLEIVGDVALYGVAVPLAALGAGVWAPVAGYFTFQLWLLVGSYVSAKYSPRWDWSPQTVRHIVRFGSGFSGASWLQKMGELVNPLVVGRYLGAEGVGYVALIIRLVDTLGFVWRATQRLSTVAFARVQDDLPRLKRAVEESMSLQLLILGPALGGFAIVVDAAVPLLFGDEWRPATRVYPWYALGFLVQSAFFVEAYVMQVKERNAGVVRAGALHVAVLSVGAAVAVPRLGIVGFGVAYALASLSWLLLHRELGAFMHVSFRRSLPWFVAWVPVLFFTSAPWPWRLLLVAFPLLVLLHPGARADLQGYGTTLLRMRRKPHDAAVAGDGDESKAVE